MAVKARSDTITLVRVSDEGISHVWEGTDGLHVSTQEKPSSGSADAGRHILLTALGILLSAEGGKTLMALTGSTASDGGAVTLYDSAGKRRLAVTTAGVTMYAADGTTQVATLAADSTLGSASGKHVVLSGSSGIALMDGTTTLASFTASAAVIGQASGKHISVTSSGIQIMSGTTTLMSVSPSSIAFGTFGEVLNSAGQMKVYGPAGAYFGAVSKDSDAGVGLLNVSGSARAILRAASYEIAGQILTSDGMAGVIKGLNAYPVGSVYLSFSTTSPASLFGGTWVRLTDVFLYATADSTTNATPAGSHRRTFTTAEMPKHTHGFKSPVYEWGTNWHGWGVPMRGSDDAGWAGSDNQYSSSGNVTASAGGGNSVNIDPKYVSVFAWRRTA